MSAYEGGCLCGQVRWRATAEPLNVRVCHCSLCRRANGAPFYARAMFPLSAFWRTGKTTSWPTSERIDRQSCAACGAPVFATPKDAPPRIAVGLATCDDRDALTPECHIWVSSKVAWVSIDDGLPQFDRGVEPGR